MTTPSLWKAFHAAQAELDNVKYDSKNPHFKSGYASLSAVLDATVPILNKHGLVLTQEIRHGNQPENSVRVTTRIVHAASGEQTQDSQVIPLAKNDPQGHGSAITYARRYAIQAMLGIASEDDDGNEASKPVKKPDPVPAPAQKPADPAKIEAVTQKLSAALGFKKV